MFSKFLKNDLKNGILLQWSKYVLSFLLFFILSLMHFLENRIFELIHPEYLEGGTTVGDYLLFIFTGIEPHDPSAQIPFTVPVLWMVVILWFLFICLYYPYNDLMRIGKHMLILSGSRAAWWFSKCIWAIATAVTYMLTALLSVSLSALCFGARLSLDVGAYTPTALKFAENTLREPPWNLGTLLVLITVVFAALGIIQLVLSLIIRPLFSYVVLCAYTLASAYFVAPFLIGSYAMAKRSESFVLGAMQNADGFIMAAWLILLGVLIGWLIFTRMDILNKD